LTCHTYGLYRWQWLWSDQLPDGGNSGSNRHTNVLPRRPNRSVFELVRLGTLIQQPRERRNSASNKSDKSDRTRVIYVPRGSFTGDSIFGFHGSRRIRRCARGSFGSSVTQYSANDKPNLH